MFYCFYVTLCYDQVFYLVLVLKLTKFQDFLIDYVLFHIFFQ